MTAAVATVKPQRAQPFYGRHPWVFAGTLDAVSGAPADGDPATAYRRAPASTLTPYLYAQIAFAMLGGWLLFAYVPDALSLVGMSLIALCGAAGAWRTVRERREPIEPAES